MADTTQLLKFACNLVNQAGQYLIKNAEQGRNDSDMKSSDIDLVTVCDQYVENFLKSEIAKCYPTHKFIGEETVSSGDTANETYDDHGSCELTDDPTWIIDPIDGTMNFVHTFPQSCISVGLFMEKEPVVAIIYNPWANQMFTAQKGSGAFLNNVKINVSKIQEMSRALVMIESGTSRDPSKMENVFANYKSIIPKVHGTRILGSAAMNMAMVAAGYADAYFEFGIHIWDIAAGELIVKEAGGIVRDPAGGDLDRLSRRVLCASTPQLADEISSNIVDFTPP